MSATVAYLIDEMKIGGAQRHIEGLLRRLPNRFRPIVFCLESTGCIGATLAANGVPVESFHCPCLWSQNGYNTFQTIRARLREEKVSILHGFLGTGCLLAPWLVSGEMKSITSRRDTGFWMGTAFRWLTRCTARRADAITANSTAVRNAAAHLEWIPPERITVIPNGIDLPAPLSPDERQTIRENLGISPNAFLVCQPATLTAVKDHDTALSALLRLARKHPETRWLFIGDGPRRRMLEEKVKDLGVAGHALFLGERDDVLQLLSASDAAVLTSRSEGFPNAVLEAMAAGLPVVSTRSGGVNDLMYDDETGLLVPVGSPDVLAQTLAKLIEDEALRTRLGAAARARVAQNFTWAKTLDATLALYDRLLAPEGCA